MMMQYTAINKSGMRITDTLEVDNPSQAYAELNRMGLMPVSITEKKKATSPDGASWHKFLDRLKKKTDTIDPRRAAKKELPFFTSQMSILLETGTPLAPSLHALQEQMNCPHWQALVARLHKHVEEGGTLASGIDLFPQVFDPIYGSMISAGEASGNLAGIMSRLADLSRQSERIRSKVVSAMIYPSLLTAIALGVLVVLVFFVLPRFQAIFDEMNVTLPASTKALLALSDFVRHRTLLFVLAAGAVVMGLVTGLRSQTGKRLVTRASMQAPIFGPLVCSIIIARIFRLIGLLLNANVPLLEALELTKTSTNNYIFADMLWRIHENVLNGEPMHAVMKQSPWVPPSMVQVVKTGEETGKIGKVMNMLSDYLDTLNETKISTLTSIMEPVILIFMGIVIGAIAISLVLPLFDLSQIAV